MSILKIKRIIVQTENKPYFKNKNAYIWIDKAQRAANRTVWKNQTTQTKKRMTYLYLTKYFRKRASDAELLEDVAEKLQSLIKPDGFDLDKLLMGYGNGYFTFRLDNSTQILCLLETHQVDGQSVDFLFVQDILGNDDDLHHRLKQNTYKEVLNQQEKELAIRIYKFRNTPYTHQIEINNFKQFEELSVKNIGQFNLVLGDNNTGKTSFLEAFTFDDSPESYIANLLYIKACREGMADFSGLTPRKLLEDFHNKHKKNDQFSITAKYGIADLQFELKPTDTFIYLEKTGLSDQGTKPKSPLAPIFSDFVSDFILRMDNTAVLAPEKRPYKNVFFEKNLFIPFIPFGRGYDTDLAGYYSANFKSLALRKELLADLKAFIPNIEVLDVSGSNIDVYETGKDMPVGISQYGEGANKLLRILLQIMSAKGKRLMIDEIDAGIHRRRFPVFWKTILKAADKHGVQLFATTHNLECVEHFAKMLETEEMEGLRNRSRTITLYRTVKNEIKARVREYEAFDEDINGGYNIMGGE